MLLVLVGDEQEVAVLLHAAVDKQPLVDEHLQVDVLLGPVRLLAILADDDIHHLLARRRPLYIAFRLAEPPLHLVYRVTLDFGRLCGCLQLHRHAPRRNRLYAEFPVKHVLATSLLLRDGEGHFT